MTRFTPEIKVGLLVLVGLAVIAYLSLKVGKPKGGEEHGYSLVAVFDTASGLKTDTPVEMAGIRIGSVRRITLEKGRARVELRIRPDVRIRRDARAVIRTRGVLGDRFVQILPGSASEPILAAGAKIPSTQSQVDVDQLLLQISAIAKDVKAVTGSLKQALGGKEGETSLREILQNTRQVTASLNEMVKRNSAIFEEILANFKDFSQDMKELSGVNKKNVTQLIANVRNASELLEDTLTGLQSIVDKVERGEGTLGKLLREDRTVNELNSTLASLRDISDKIKRGEGTLGKLVNDPSIADKLDNTLKHVNRMVERADRFKIYVGYRGEYLLSGQDVKSYVNLRIQPSEDKYYLLGIVDDPHGRLRTKVTETQTVSDNGTSQFEYKTEKQVDEDELKFTAQMAKRYFDTTIRGGIIESTGGFGVDQYLFDDNLRLSAEVFDFSTDRNPHIKLYADAALFEHLYFTAGYDDAISDRSRQSFFVGIGLRFQDEDLKTLLGGTKVSLY